MAVSDLPITESGSGKRRIGSTLADFLYPRPARRTVGSIFKWWERRRLAYNAIISVGGAVSLSGLWLGFLLIGNPVSPGFILTPVIPVLLAANACYTLGPIVESLAHKLWGREVLPIGPHLFRAGLIFSVGLTLVLPMILLGFQLALRLLQALI